MGVKSLWSLLTPVGRPVMLENVEGKTMAIDSSIWIYQFQATMRDKDGRALVNAHVLGFLRRISKLLFYGIKPVFVFDGGAPALKRSTISERKKKKAGAAASHAKLAEKLLAAQMRREALNHAQAPQASTSKTSKGKSKAPPGPVLIEDDTVYLEDIDNSVPKTPSKRAGKEKASPDTSPASSSKKKSRFHDHDPYRLPDVDIQEAVAAATRSNTAPDPRLATEDELRAFIEDMRPEDFDVTSPAFRELPTEVQYEIVGDLRLKSRQTSYKRLQGMLQKAHTPLDFSRQQIKNLKQRNSLTQQLLMTTDNIGKAHLAIPVRIASERNKEYVLMKNEGEGGGWILGIRDEGTQEKPIEIDQDSDKEHQDDEDSDMEMEEVSIPATAVPDPDLREYRRGLALSAVGERASRPSQNPTKPIQRRQKTKPLFVADEDDDNEQIPGIEDSEEDPELAFAIQESFDHGDTSYSVGSSPAAKTRLAATNLESLPSTSSVAHPTTPSHRSSMSKHVDPDSDSDDMYASPTRLETALSFANARPYERPNISPQTSAFGKPTLLTASHPTSPIFSTVPIVVESDSDNEMEEIVSAPPVTNVPVRLSTSNIEPVVSIPHARAQSPAAVLDPQVDSDDDMEEVHMSQPETRGFGSDTLTERQEIIPAKSQSPASLQPTSAASLYNVSTTSPLSSRESSIAELLSRGERLPTAQAPNPDNQILSVGQVDHRIDSDDEGDVLTDWTRSPSPVGGPSNKFDGPSQASADHEDWDAAQEMDAHAEEGEFARFVSQVKGRDLDDVRAEIDEEIKSLNQQRKIAMRDSEDITQQMISQIMLMLRLFGIPYITAPMEAEAQCAELVSLGLVEGIITDDSDVFLFGGLRVFKNMFNQSKTVECFLLSDLGRELGLDRDTLVRLAYLLGSDYVEGLPGVGPVVAMELLKEFPGNDGLHKFKDWWLKVQTGKDKPGDNKSKFRKRFKKKFKDLYLPNEWPNPAVRDAYYHPTVDDSDEPFKWGLPDLDGLRHFLREELGWHQTKVDELLLPIIQKVGKRGQAAAMNKQGNLNEFLDVSAGSGTYAPRKRQVYSSKRLQQVVSEFRSEKTKLRMGHSPTPGTSGNSGESDSDADKGFARKRRKTGKIEKARTAPGTSTRKTAGRGRGRGRGRGAKAAKEKDTSTETANNEEDEEEYMGNSGDVVGFPPQLRPRPIRKLARKEGGSESDEIDSHEGALR